MKVYHNEKEYNVLSIMEVQKDKTFKLTLESDIPNHLKLENSPLIIKIEKGDSMGSYDLTNIISIGVLGYTIDGSSITIKPEL